MHLTIAGRFGTILVALGLVACGPKENPDDQDGDGFTAAQGDCADFDPSRFPGATETCNVLDDDCDTIIDDGFDLDFDGFSSCSTQTDCDELDPARFPGNEEIADGKDNDCDGTIDNNLATTDDDGDGTTELQGDCDDDDPARSPLFPEIEGDLVDNDCNAQIDEPPTPCDQQATNANNTADIVKALGLCHGEVISAQFVGPSDPTARALISNFGNAATSAFEGNRMLHLSSGLANTAAHSQGTNLNPANGAENQRSYPDPKPDPNDGCSSADPAFANDYTELLLTVRAPAGAESASFRFQFFSAEYPRFRCDDFDDTFLAILDANAFQGNVAFDANNNVVSVNSGFFEICNSITGQGAGNNTCPISPNPTLNNTGYDPTANDVSGPGPDGAATRPLTTTFPVSPGETFTLRFIIFDEGENNNSANFGHILDSSVLLDNFVWHADPIEDPNTIP
jgi:Putative metal-binding motif